MRGMQCITAVLKMVMATWQEMHMAFRSLEWIPADHQQEYGTLSTRMNLEVNSPPPELSDENLAGLTT